MATICNVSGLLLLHTVKPSGKKAQSGWDFANGNRLDPGEKLGD
jgi:methionyl-tRNA formyltransferase